MLRAPWVLVDDPPKLRTTPPAPTTPEQMASSAAGCAPPGAPAENSIAGSFGTAASSGGGARLPHDSAHTGTRPKPRTLHGVTEIKLEAAQSSSSAPWPTKPRGSSEGLLSLTFGCNVGLAPEVAHTLTPIKGVALLGEPGALHSVSESNSPFFSMTASMLAPTELTLSAAERKVDQWL